MLLFNRVRVIGIVEPLLAACLLMVLVLSGCSKSSNSVAVSPTSSGGGGRGSGGASQPGVITAGEWNDLDNWSFWLSVANNDDFNAMPAYWSLYNTNRVSVVVTGTDSLPIADAEVILKNDGVIVYKAKTDNMGKAELWTGLFQLNNTVDYTKLYIEVNQDTFLVGTVKPYSTGINEIIIPSTRTVSNNVQIAFVVDATGSMGDELSYLKTELFDVISRAKSGNPNATLFTSSIFYRDEGDQYVTRISDFTTDISATMSFINNQSADGGGDFPEAVHTALYRATNELLWLPSAKTRLLFLLLDAPPHHNPSVISSLQASIATAAEKGVKIIPITASGIDKETESLMRYMAMSTNGTYVFITDDSGVGNGHLQATVGAYQVEQLNNLLVRLISKYAQ